MLKERKWAKEIVDTLLNVEVKLIMNTVEKADMFNAFFYFSLHKKGQLSDDKHS